MTRPDSPDTRSSPFTITGAHLTRIDVPITESFLSARRCISSYPKTIIRLETDEGLSGIGETWGSPEIFALVKQLAGRLVSQVAATPQDFTRLLFQSRHQDDLSLERRFAIGGLDMALWDLLGKHKGLPLHELLGSARRKDIPMVCEMSAAPLDPGATQPDIDDFFDDPRNLNEVVDKATQIARRDGYRFLKMKSTGKHPDWDHDLMSALREALGSEMQLRIDPNAGYPFAVAQELCQRLDPIGLQWFEDPVAGLADMGRLRKAVDTPIATNMCVVLFNHLQEAKRLGAVDIVGVDVFEWGGLANVQRLIKQCENTNFGVFGHCYFDLGIATAANLHIAAAFPTMTNGVDTCLYLQQEDIIQDGPFEVVNGCLSVPQGSGLGVVLDDDALARFAIEEHHLAA